MKRSEERILTTHVGSLIRPKEIRDILSAKQNGVAVDEAYHRSVLTDSVADIVRRQAEAGIDIVSDGEFGKSISWSQYVLERLSGFERRPVASGAADPFARGLDRERFPEFYAELDAHDRAQGRFDGGSGRLYESVCVAPIAYTGQDALRRDIDNFKAALAGLVGRENVIGSTDCGFAQSPFHRRVHPTIQWAKLGALAEGARLASERLWKH